MAMPRIRLILGAILLASPALASDGVREINATCAVQTGCFAGDAAGLPVTISAKGSYRLTSNLAITNVDTSAIVVVVDDVEIDLAGFGIHGPVACTGSPLTCSPNLGSGNGVQSAISIRGVAVRDGAITGMGGSGISLGPQASITQMRLRENRIYGINAGNGSLIRGNTIQANGTVGIFGASNSVIESNSVFLTGFIGIQVGAAALITDNSVRDNEGAGISASAGSTISNNTVYSNDGDGIFASLGCLVIGNTVYGNGSAGLSLATNAGYRENVIQANGTATVFGGANLGNNLCNGLTTCP